MIRPIGGLRGGYSGLLRRSRSRQSESARVVSTRTRTHVPPREVDGGEHPGKGAREDHGWNGNGIPSNQTSSCVRLTNVSALLSLLLQLPLSLSLSPAPFVASLERIDWRGIDCERISLSLSLSAATEILRKSARRATRRKRNVFLRGPSRAKRRDLKLADRTV